MPKKPVGKEIIVFDRLSSTNQKARELLREQDLAEGTIIMAKDQFAGKGFASNSWESQPEKNITISCILHPTFLPPHQQFWLTKILSLTVADVVKKRVPPEHSTMIKWPNDIYVDDKKIAGILAENSILGDKIKESICGIGLNVNQEIFYSRAPNPVSIKQITKSDTNLQDLLIEISDRLTYWYDKLQQQEFDFIGDAYLNSLYRFKKLSSFESNGINFHGRIIGTNAYGRLQIETDNGTIREFDFKEVSFVPGI
jgi:BirA family transcriptional regulator, biotin operon repressor / biotin---[acetyl-CoA-carboxylase] ligase